MRRRGGVLSVSVVVSPNVVAAQRFSVVAGRMLLSPNAFRVPWWCAVTRWCGDVLRVLLCRNAFQV
jgi:hypothetical protein